MNIIQKILKNSGIVILGRIADSLFNLVISVSLARYFGQGGFGKLSFLTIFFFFLINLDNLWIRPILIREMAKDKIQAGRLMGNGFIIRLLVSLFIILLFLVSLQVTNCPPDVKKLALFTIIGLFLTSIATSYGMILQVNLKMKYFVGANLMSKTSVLIIIYIVIFLNGTLFQYYILSIFPLIISIFLIKHYSEKFIKPKFEIDVALWRKIFRESWPLALTAIFIFIYHRLSQLILLRMKGADALGSFSVAVNLAESFNIIPMALMTSMLPLMSRYYKISLEFFEKAYQLSFKYLLLFIIPVAVGITIFSEFIISALYGKQFLSSSPVLCILIWAEVFIFMGVINNTILIAANKQIIDPIFTGVSAFVNILLNLLLIPRYGIIGAAVASLITYPVGPIMGFFLKSTRAYSLCMFRFMLKPLFASLLMGYAIRGFHFNLWLAIIISPIIYIMVMYLIRGVGHSDLLVIKSIVRS